MVCKGSYKNQGGWLLRTCICVGKWDSIVGLEKFHFHWVRMSCSQWLALTSLFLLFHGFPTIAALLNCFGIASSRGARQRNSMLKRVERCLRPRISSQWSCSFRIRLVKIDWILGIWANRSVDIKTSAQIPFSRRIFGRTFYSCKSHHNGKRCDLMKCIFCMEHLIFCASHEYGRDCCAANTERAVITMNSPQLVDKWLP